LCAGGGLTHNAMREFHASAAAAAAGARTGAGAVDDVEGGDTSSSRAIAEGLEIFDPPPDEDVEGVEQRTQRILSGADSSFYCTSLMITRAEYECQC
jgi:hypothetical protein